MVTNCRPVEFTVRAGCKSSCGHHDHDCPMPTSRVRARMVVLGEIAPLAKHGEIGNGRKNESRDDNIRSTHYGTDTEYTLRQPVELLSCCRLQSIPHSDGLLPCCFSLQSCDSGLCVSGPAAAGVLIFVCGVISSICSASIKSVSI